MAEPDPADVNPYAPPVAPLGETPVAAQGELGEAEAVRRRYLRHEASVKSIGWLHYLASGLFLLPLVSEIVEPTGQIENNLAFRFGFLLSYFLVAAFHAAMGFGLTRLKTGARWVEVAIVGLAFLLMLSGVVVGVIMSVARAGPAGPGASEILSVMIVYGLMGLILGYVLYLLLGKKGTVVFSREYRAVIDRTPHIKYRSSCLMLALILIVLFVVVAGMMAFLGFSTRRF